MNKYTILLVLVAIFSCHGEKWSRISKLDAYIEDFSSLELVENVVVLPTTVSCEYCVSKVYEFLERLELPKNTLFVLSGSSESDIKKISNTYQLVESPQIIFDTENFFFKEQLVFVNPVLFSRENKEWITTEIVPLNVDLKLGKLFGFGSCNQKIINSIWPLEFRGTVKNIDFIDNQVKLNVRNFEGPQVDTTFFLPDGSLDYFNGNIVEGTLIQKEKFSLDYYLITLIDSMSATVKKHGLRCQ